MKVFSPFLPSAPMYMSFAEWKWVMSEFCWWEYVCVLLARRTTNDEKNFLSGLVERMDVWENEEVFSQSKCVCESTSKEKQTVCKREKECVCELVSATATVEKSFFGKRHAYKKVDCCSSSPSSSQLLLLLWLLCYVGVLSSFGLLLSSRLLLDSHFYSHV